MPIINSQYCRIVQQDELECLHIKHPHFFAEICLQGAQLTRFTHESKGDFLWLSPTAEYQLGQSLRGGVPICWPWFGVLDKNPNSVISSVNGKQGSHGFARTSMWQLTSVHEDTKQVVVELSLTSSAHTQSIWPHLFELTCRFIFADELTIELNNKNTGKNAFTISQALHTYLPTTDIQKTSINGAENLVYVDALDNWQEKSQHGPILFNSEVDRIYKGKLNANLVDNTTQFHLKSNSLSSVIWNPWIDKSKTLSQFPDKAYLNMLCIENGNILEDVVHLEPNESHTLSMTLTKD